MLLFGFKNIPRFLLIVEWGNARKNNILVSQKHCEAICSNNAYSSRAEIKHEVAISKRY